MGSTKLGSCSGVEVLVRTLPELSHAQKNGCWAHCPPTQPPTRAHLRACSTVRRDFHRIALLPAMGARVVLIVNRGWHTNP